MKKGKNYKPVKITLADTLNEKGIKALSDIKKQMEADEAKRRENDRSWNKLNTVRQ